MYQALRPDASAPGPAGARETRRGYLNSTRLIAIIAMPMTMP